MMKAKQALFDILSAMGGLLLIALAVVVIVLLVVPAFIWKAWASITQENRKAREILEGTKDFFVNIACSFDQTGNVAYGGFFTWLFLTKKSKYHFGNFDDTISFVLGFNQKAKTLSKTGKIMVKILDWLDKQHCEIALELGIVNARIKLKMYDKL